MAQKEKFKVYGNVFDAFTLRLLFKLSSQGFFEDLVSPISLGKEANVFSASKQDGTLVAVKIYRLENCNFNTMWGYLKSDPRFERVKPSKRNIIFAWVQREYRNLLKAREAGVFVPTPIHIAHHIVVEEYLGEGKVAAPQLHKADFEDVQAVFDSVVKQMSLLYKKAGIVHADLSSFNILYHQQKPFFIDMSQATSVEDVQAKEYLVRDIHNICTFFEKCGLVCDRQKVFDDIVT
ncbi:MAG: serine protein kinase RIO [Candidatus Woesearchaeota archaeon]